MAAVSLFWDINMAAVTSCENTLSVFQRYETVVLVHQENPVGVELFSHARFFFFLHYICIADGHVSKKRFMEFR